SAATSSGETITPMTGAYAPSWTGQTLPDAALDNYVGTTTSGLGGEHRILDPNGLWKHDAAMTTGDFTGNGRTDDLVIRWSDGETTMYADTLANQLGTEHMLVAPTS
ncbi:hypothetical protein ACFWD7_53070, partial [Streptomyces mirabilis]